MDEILKRAKWRQERVEALQQIQERFTPKMERVVRALRSFHEAVLEVQRLSGGPGAPGAPRAQQELFADKLLSLCETVRETEFGLGVEHILGRDRPRTGPNDRMAIHLFRVGWGNDRAGVLQWLDTLTKLPHDADNFDRDAVNQSDVWRALQWQFDVIIPWPFHGGVHPWHPDVVEADLIKAELSRPYPSAPAVSNPEQEVDDREKSNEPADATVGPSAHAETPRTNERRAVILTAIRAEFEAVRRHLSGVRAQQHPLGTVYEQGIFDPPTGKSWTVLVVETGMGNAPAAQEAERAISFFDPGVALFVGVAGGIKDVKLGDVVAATKVYGYEAGKDAHEFLPRPSVAESSYRLQQLAKYLGRNSQWYDDWLGRIKLRPADLRPAILVAPLAAGEKVVAATQSATYEFLRGSYSDAVAVDMEGRGFFQTSLTYSNVLSIVVRGISDVIDGKEASDAAGYQEVAAATAAAFAFELLGNLQDDR